MAQDGLNTRDDGGLFPRLQQRYGLRENPVEMETPFFTEAGRQQALETLRHLSGFGDMVLAVSGPAGVGKTRLLAELVSSESSRLDFHRIPISALTGPLALARYLRQVAHSGIEEDTDPDEAVYQYFHWSESRAHKGQRQVLLVDEADGGNVDAIALLLSAFLASDRAAAAVPVLAGRDSLEGLLTPAVGASNLHQVVLRPLTEPETADYLRPRVERAGGKPAELLSPARLKKIQALSHGTFAGIRRVAPGVWLDMVAGASGGSGLKLPSFAVWRWPVLALVLLGASWWFVSQQYDDAISRTVQPEEPERERKSITIGPGSEDTAPEAQDTGEMPADPAPTQPQEPLPSENEPVQAAPEPEPEPEPASSPESVPEAREEAPEPAEPAFEPARPEAFVALGELRQRSGWTMQLVAGNYERTILRVMDRAADGANLVYTLGERQGEPWFMLFYGTYPSKDAARNAARALPDGLGVSEPWVRSFDSL